MYKLLSYINPKPVKHIELNKNKKAFSLVEMLVSLGIISIIMVIFFNAMLISLNVTVRNNIRSNIREELSTVASLITKDIRASDRLDSNECRDSSCTMIVAAEEVTWSKCGDQICREDSGGVVTYRTDSDINITNFTFDQAFVDETTALKNNVIITIVGSHVNESLEINNLIRQVSTSTRNYEL